MGCNSSQSVSVINVRSSSTIEKHEEIAVRKSVTLPSLVEGKALNTKIEQKPKFNPLVPLPNNKFQNTSATDSGVSSKNYDDNESLDFDEDVKTETSEESSSSEFEYLDDEYKDIITEKSKQELVQRVEKSFIDRNGLELSVSGKSCPPLLTKKEREDLQLKEENLSLDMLRNNGLIQKPLAIKSNYAHFEIVEQEKSNRLFSRNQSTITAQSSSTNDSASSSSNKKFLPLRWQQSEKTKPILTADQIEEKLLKANLRRKEQNKLKTKNSFSMERKKSDIDSIRNTNQSSEFDQELYERQTKLREIRDKLKARDNSEIISPRTPRSKELVSELEKFRPKTSTNFRPDFN